LNGGVCKDNKCICRSGFQGVHCETEIARGCTGENCECSNNPCVNGGTCINNESTAAGYVCKCLAGYSGEQCELNIEEGCRKNCIHGVCALPRNSNAIKCFCEPGYTGLFCDQDVNECLTVPCKNNATCIDRVNDFDCECTPGFTGKVCEENINECASNPCFAGSTCIDEINGFTCQCIAGMTGKLCDQVRDSFIFFLNTYQSGKFQYSNRF
jgi:protein crumbs